MTQSSGHDPLCPVSLLPDGGCRCALIARVRADEREQIANGSLSWVRERVAEEIAQAIEGERGREWQEHLRGHIEGQCRRCHGMHDAYYRAAAIARRIGGAK